MGVLYYFQREDDRELFALNKVYRYADKWIEADDWMPAPTLEETRQAMTTSRDVREWPDRIHARLSSWAGGQRIRCISENHWDVYDEEEGPITGSVYDADYGPDGVTYIQGSAW